MLSDSESIIFAELAGSGSNVTLTGARAIVEAGVASLSELVLYAEPDAAVSLKVSCPTNAEMTPVFVEVAIDECSPGMVQELTSQGDVVCAICGMGSCELNGQSCVGCPQGLECDAPGLSVAAAALSEGFWRAGPESIDVRPCPHLDSCVGTRRNTSGVCREGNRGPYCSLCEKGLSRSSQSGKCEPCAGGVDRDGGGGRDGSIIARVVAVSLVMVLALVFSTGFIRTGRVRFWRQPEEQNESESEDENMMRSVAFVKSGLNFCQLISGLSLVYQIEWPLEFGGMMQWMSGIVSIDVMSLLPLDCAMRFTHDDKLVVTLGGTLALNTLIGVAHRCIRQKDATTRILHLWVTINAML